MKSLLFLAFFLYGNLVINAQNLEYRLPRKEGSKRKTVFYSCIITNQSTITLYGLDSINGDETFPENRAQAFLLQLNSNYQTLQHEYVSPEKFYAVYPGKLESTLKGFLFYAYNNNGDIDQRFQLGFRDSLLGPINDTTMSRTFSFYQAYESYNQGNDQLIRIAFGTPNFEDTYFRYNSDGQLKMIQLLKNDCQVPRGNIFSVIDSLIYYTIKDTLATTLKIFGSNDQPIITTPLNNFSSASLFVNQNNKIDIYLLSDSLINKEHVLEVVHLQNGILPQEKIEIGKLEGKSKLIQLKQNPNGSYFCVSKLLKLRDKSYFEKDSMLIFTHFDGLGGKIYEKKIPIQGDSIFFVLEDSLVLIANVLYDQGSNISRLLISKYQLDGIKQDESIIYRPEKIELREFRRQRNGYLTLVGKQDKDAWFMGLREEALGFGLQTRNNYNFLAYPNPTHGKLILEGLENGTVINVFDFTGKLVDTSTVIDGKINIESLPLGNYLLVNPNKNAKYVILKSK